MRNLEDEVDQRRKLKLCALFVVRDKKSQEDDFEMS